MPQDAPPDGGARDEAPQGSWSRVAGMQAKLHRWAVADPGRRFDDLFNFVCDPATLIVAFDRVAGNRGANTPGVDGWTVKLVEERIGVPGFLDDLRAALKDGSFRPLPVRERLIPKPAGSGKLRKLGIPAVADKVVQAALKLVLEPIFEADFEPVSYGFRPMRRAHDAIAEVHHFGTCGYRWVLDADIEAAFDNLSHCAVMERVRARVKDKRVLALVKAFLKAGVLTEAGGREETWTGTPQGGIFTPPTHLATSASMWRWVTAGWRSPGAPGTIGDRLGSTFMSGLVAVRRRRGTPSASTPPWTSRGLACRRRRRRAGWRAGSLSRGGRRAGMSIRRRPAGAWWCRGPRWCSPSSCPRRWRCGCGRMPGRPGSPSRRWWRRRWRSFSHGVPGTIPAGEQLAGRDGVRLGPSRGHRFVSGLRDVGAAAAGPRQPGRPGREITP
jgi:retron-type reverse transcriptase